MSLPTTCRSAGHRAAKRSIVPAVADRRRVVDERVEPDVDDAGRIERQRNAPRLPRPADRDVLEPALEQAQDLVAARSRAGGTPGAPRSARAAAAGTSRGGRSSSSPDPLRLGLVDRAQPVDQVLLLLERLAADAVPALVDALVDVAVVAAAPAPSPARPAMPRLGGADEVVERDVEAAPRRRGTPAPSRRSRPADPGPAPAPACRRSASARRCPSGTTCRRPPGAGSAR